MSSPRVTGRVVPNVIIASLLSLNAAGPQNVRFTVSVVFEDMFLFKTLFYEDKSDLKCS